MIIGISGTFSSGQDTLGQYLQDNYGFLRVSTSDIVREVAKEQRYSIERPILVEVASELRRKYGGGILVQRALDRYHNSIQQYSGVVITGIRSLGEAKEIKTAGGVIVFTDAPFEDRYNRMKARARDAEATITTEEFKKREEQEASTGALDTDFNREKIREVADIFITNEATEAEFFEKAVQALKLKI